MLRQMMPLVAPGSRYPALLRLIVPEEAAKSGILGY
jgi:hypothetical protein